MPAKKTDWKRERKLFQAWLQNQPDNHFDPGTELLPRGNRESVGNTDGEGPQSRDEAMAMLQMGHDRRHDAHMGISKTMQQRLQGLFGGTEGRSRNHPPRSVRK